MPQGNCTGCGAAILPDEPTERCAHGLRCEVCIGQDAECFECAKADEAQRERCDADEAAKELYNPNDFRNEAILIPSSPERIAFIASVKGNHKDYPAGSSIPGTKARRVS